MVAKTKPKQEEEAEVLSFPIDGHPPLLPPFIIARDDLTNDEAWEKLQEKGIRRALLNITDFEDIELYDQYFLVSQDLLMYPYIFVSGDVGGGKSFWINWFLHRTAYHFGKRNAINWVAKNPTLMSPFNKWKEGDKEKPYYSLTEQDYVDKLQDEVNELDTKLKKEMREPTRAECEKLIVWNANLAFDEGSGVGDKSARTNLTKITKMAADRRRHFFLSIIMCFVNPEDADERMIYKNATHLVGCQVDPDYYDSCKISIYNKKYDITRVMHMKPSNWTHLWDTHNFVSMNTSSNISFGQKKAKEIEKKRKVFEVVQPLEEPLETPKVEFDNEIERDIKRKKKYLKQEG